MTKFKLVQRNTWREGDKKNKEGTLESTASPYTDEDAELKRGKGEGRRLRRSQHRAKVWISGSSRVVFIPFLSVVQVGTLPPFSTQTRPHDRWAETSGLMNHAAHGQSLQRTGELGRTSDWKADYELTS